MFESKIKSDTLKEIVEASSLLVDDGKFTIGPNSILFKAVDPAHIAMIEMEIAKEAFTVYKADEGEIGLSLDKLKKVVRLSSPEDEILLKLLEGEGRLEVSFANLRHRMALLDASSMRDPKTPQIEFPLQFVFTGAQLAQGIRAASTLSDYLTFTAKPEGLELGCRGDTDVISITFPKEELPLYNCKENYRSIFGLEYLTSLMKIVKVTDELTILMGNDLPIKIEFSVANGNGKIKYLLAPRIEPES
jgi:proliferating cell nuclear antigen